jgi:hypothetical protein
MYRIIVGLIHIAISWKMLVSEIFYNEIIAVIV